jgi:hypothetical protein
MAGARDLVDTLVRTFPGVKEVYDGHLRENLGELLPHVFFGDLTRFVIEEHRRERPGRSSRMLVDSLLEFLEAGLAGPDPDVQEVIVVSFLENLWQAEGEYGSLVERLGPEMRAALERLERER